MNKKLFCFNCNKFGHTNKECTSPVVSIGMILIYVDNIIKDKIFNNIKNINFINDINEFNYKRINNIKKINFYKDKIKFLIIEKKHSLNYIEFLRGKYEKNDKQKLIKMFKLMSNNEIEMVKSKSFLELWNNLWKKTAKKKIYQKEFNDSKQKFEYLVKNNILDELLTIKSQYNTPEWELPKGRKNINEKNIECAIREINEETNIDSNLYHILNITDSFQDIFFGTNNILYKHIYYLSIFNNNINLVLTDFKSNKEVNSIKLVTIDELKNYIRNYNTSKIELLNNIFLFLMNLAENNNYEEVFLEV
jgi:8-oxo-dGTP pyrophosphatase MutT (NUDIX family)